MSSDPLEPVLKTLSVPSDAAYDEPALGGGDCGCGCGGAASVLGGGLSGRSLALALLVVLVIVAIAALVRYARRCGWTRDWHSWRRCGSAAYA